MASRICPFHPATADLGVLTSDHAAVLIGYGHSRVAVLLLFAGERPHAHHDLDSFICNGVIRLEYTVDWWHWRGDGGDIISGSSVCDAPVIRHYES